MWIRAAPTRGQCGIPALREKLVSLGGWSAIVRSHFPVEHAAVMERNCRCVVAQEGPVAANVFQLMQVDFAEQQFLPCVEASASTRRRGRRKRASPELEALPAPSCRGMSPVSSRRDSQRQHKPIRNRVRPLDGAHGIMCASPNSALSAGCQSDGTWVKKNAGSLPSA